MTTYLPTDDSAKFELIRKSLYSPVIGDVLDGIGRTHQFLPPDIRPILPNMVLVGRAMPVLIADVFGAQARPFGKLTEALDSLQAGDVYFARTGRLNCASWGEILTTTARIREAAGVVTDGFHRDTSRVIAQDWPVFSRGGYGQDAGVRASVIDFGIPVEMGALRVEPGDLVFGDMDGVVVIPRSIENEVLELAFNKVTAEHVTRAAIECGMSSTEAFATYGVL